LHALFQRGVDDLRCVQANAFVDHFHAGMGRGPRSARRIRMAVEAGLADQDLDGRRGRARDRIGPARGNVAMSSLDDTSARARANRSAHDTRRTPWAQAGTHSPVVTPAWAQTIEASMILPRARAFRLPALQCRRGRFGRRGSRAMPSPARTARGSARSSTSEAAIGAPAVSGDGASSVNLVYAARQPARRIRSGEAPRIRFHQALLHIAALDRRLPRHPCFDPREARARHPPSTPRPSRRSPSIRPKMSS